MIDFDREVFYNLKYMGMQFSRDSQESITNYLFHGLNPGGHLSAMFAYDYERALFNADIHNRQVFWATAMWIRECAPPQCQGSYEAVTAWCNDQAARDKYRVDCEKKAMWNALKETSW